MRENCVGMISNSFFDCHFVYSASSDQISGHRKRKPYSPPVQVRSGLNKQDVNNNEMTSAVRSGMTVEQKRQLLWGKKKEQQEEIAIRWDTAEFQTTEQRSKFQRLMVLYPYPIRPFLIFISGNEDS